jgi:superfamily II DNA or RNA helicase
MSDIVVTKYNESFVRVQCDPDIAREISDTYTFEVPGAKFMPAYKMGRFDGKIRIFNLGARTLPYGLVTELKSFAGSRNYSIEIDIPEHTDVGLTYKDIQDFAGTLGIEKRIPPIEVRDYQINGAYQALKNKRAILHAATGAGKSLVLFIICRYIIDELQMRVLIVVPTISLTSQMKSDFADYASGTDWSADDNVHCITAGVDKNIKKPITVSTFQSIYKMPSEWLNQFGAMIGDEGHKIVAKTITGIYERATQVEYKLACTGTLHDMKCNLLVMKGITGEVYEIATTATLIENKQLVPLTIKAIILNHPEEVAKAMKKVDYDTEIKYIVSNSKRNNFVAKLASQCKGTTLVLFRFVDLQGTALYSMVCDKAPTRNVRYIDGTVTGIARESIRKDANIGEDDIIVASYATFSTGINLPAIENIIFAHPAKSAITIIQSIGRGLRLKEGKDKCVLYDISDNMTFGKKANISYRHLGDRLGTYTRDGFTYSIINVNFK